MDFTSLFLFPILPSFFLGQLLDCSLATVSLFYYICFFFFFLSPHIIFTQVKTELSFFVVFCFPFFLISHYWELLVSSATQILFHLFLFFFLVITNYHIVGKCLYSIKNVFTLLFISLFSKSSTQIFIFASREKMQLYFIIWIHQEFIFKEKIKVVVIYTFQVFPK